MSGIKFVLYKSTDIFVAMVLGTIKLIKQTLLFILDISVIVVQFLDFSRWRFKVDDS